MIHPARWRETCDPLSLDLQRFRLLEVLGYPHARNDVFHVRGLLDGVEQTAYIKVARHPDSAIANEVHILSQLDAPEYPRVLEAGSGDRCYAITSELPGERLSFLAQNDEAFDSLEYMEAYGEALAKLHQLHIDAPPQATRKFHLRPAQDLLAELNLTHLEPFFAAPPPAGTTVFCHGDLHYANVLWVGHQPSAILDFELAGYGNRDFDVAWAIFLRPGQRFLQTDAERSAFLRGYCRHGACDEDAIRYYTAQCYVWFLSICGKNEEYARYIRQWLARNIPGST